MDALSLIIGGIVGGLLAFVLAGLCVCASRDDNAKMLARAMFYLSLVFRDLPDRFQGDAKAMLREYYQVRPKKEADHAQS